MSEKLATIERVRSVEKHQHYGGVNFVAYMVTALFMLLALPVAITAGLSN